MRDQEIIGLWEAYQQVHSQPEEVEQLDEGRNTSLSALAREKQQRQNPKGKFDRDKSLMMGHNSPSAYKYKKDPETGSWSNEGRRDGATESELRTKVSQRALRNRRGNVDAVPKKNGRPMFESAEDLFDIILEHLVAEGYADTNKAALAIMANMSEEWKQSITEGLLSGLTKVVPTVARAVQNAPKVLGNASRAIDKTLSYYEKNPTQALPFLAPAIASAGMSAKKEDQTAQQKPNPQKPAPQSSGRPTPMQRLQRRPDITIK